MAAFDPSAFDSAAFDSGSVTAATNPLPDGIHAREVTASLRVLEANGLRAESATQVLRVRVES